MRSIFLILLLSLAAFFAAAQDKNYRVQPKLAPAAIDPVLARVDPTKDRWVGEQDYEDIQARLKDIAKELVEGKREFPPLTDAVARFARLHVAELKIVSSGRLSDLPPTARIRARAELGGMTAGGERLSLLGHLIMVWKQKGEHWNLQEAMTSPMKEQRAPDGWFTDVTGAALGHNFSYREQMAKGTDHWRTALDEAVGVGLYGHNGITVADYDNDGWEDFYVSQPSGLPNRLYRNNGDGTFTDTTREAGLDLLDDVSMSLFADLDNDGDQDFLALASSEPLLFRNNGQGKFTFDPNSGLASPKTRATTLIHMALADYDQDGDLDLYACSHVFWTPGVTYTEPTPYYDANNGPPNILFRNRGDGAFEDATESSGLNQNNTRFSIAAGWGDYDNDGDQDLYVANDYGRNNLYRNQGDGTFVDVAAAAGVEDMAAGMSVSWADFDSDGWLDLYISNMWSSAGQRVTYSKQFSSVAREESTKQSFQRHSRGNTFFHNNGDGSFTDVTIPAGVGVGRWAWGSGFTDLDNDGRQDIYVTNGFVTGPDVHDL